MNSGRAAPQDYRTLTRGADDARRMHGGPGMRVLVPNIGYPICVAGAAAIASKGAVARW